MDIKSLAGKGIKFLAKHDRAILTGINIASTVAAVAFTWHARPRCEELLDELNEQGATKKEKAIALAKELALPAAAVGISVGSSLLGLKKGTEKIAAAVNAASTYKMVDDIRKEIVKEEVGEQKAAEIEKKVAQEGLKATPLDTFEKTGHGDVKFIETEYMGRRWLGSKDYFDLCVEKANNKLESCYDRYGTCARDDFALTFWDIAKIVGLERFAAMDILGYYAREYRKLPVDLEPYEFTNDDGSTELGYRVVFTERPSFVYTDIVR